MARRRVEDQRSGTERSNHSSNDDTVCSICLGDLNNPVDTNCGHSFCAQCMITHWEHDRWPNPCRCPVCRRDVTLLMGAEEWSFPNNRELFNKVASYNQQMATREQGFFTRLRDAPALSRHLWRDMTTLRGGVPYCSRIYFFVLALAVMIYFVSPVDLIPEGIFGIFGLVDDILAIVLMLIYLADQYRVHIINIREQPQR